MATEFAPSDQKSGKSNKLMVLYWAAYLELGECLHVEIASGLVILLPMLRVRAVFLNDNLRDRRDREKDHFIRRQRIRLSARFLMQE